MRLVLSSTALIAGGFLLACSASIASAAPIPPMKTLSVDSTAVEAVRYRRPIIVEEGDDIVVLPGVRPRSCGEYHYWDGVACVDARYNDPYLGPK